MQHSWLTSPVAHQHEWPLRRGQYTREGSGPLPPPNLDGLEHRVCYSENAVTTIADLALLIQSRYPLIAVETVEEQRFERTPQQGRITPRSLL